MLALYTNTLFEIKTLANQIFPQKRRVLYLGFLAAFSLLTFDLYQPALPTITQYYQTTHALGQLTLSAFFFIFGLSQLIWGPLIDHYGRIRCLKWSLAVYFVATLACIAANRIEILILARCLQGFAACCSNVIAFSSAREVESSTKRAQLISLIAMIVSVSPIFAPLIGSFIFINFHWQATFLFMLLLGSTSLLLMKPCLNESLHFKKQRSLLTYRLVIKKYQEVLLDRHLWISMIILASSYSCIMIEIVNSAYLIIDKLDYSPLFFSIIFAFNGFMLIIGHSIGLKLRQHKTLVWNIKCGSLCLLAGSLLLTGGFYIYGMSLLTLTPVLLIGLGTSLLNPPTFSLALENHPHNAGTVTAILNTIRITCASTISGIVASLLVWDIHFFAISMLIISAFLAVVVAVYFRQT